MWLVHIFYAMIGLVMGSFLCLVSERLVREESIVLPHSHCESCGHMLAVCDLVPVFSYLCLGGRCRYCGAAIGEKSLVLELLTASLFLLAGWQRLLDLDLLWLWVYISLLLIISAIDYSAGVIYDWSVVAASLWGLVRLAQCGGGEYMAALSGFALGGGILLIIYVVSRGGMGQGDVLLGASIGLTVGYPLALLSLMLAFISGALVGVFLIFSGRKKRQDGLSFAPFLCGGGVVALLYGQQLVQWYSAWGR